VSWALLEQHNHIYWSFLYARAALTFEGPHMIAKTRLIGILVVFVFGVLNIRWIVESTRLVWATDVMNVRGALNVSADMHAYPKNMTQLPHSMSTTLAKFNFTAAEASIRPGGGAVVNELSSLKTTATNLATSTCMRAAAYGQENQSQCWGKQLVKSVTVRAPNCDEACGGTRYHNPNPHAKYTIELVTDGAFHAVQNSQANCKLALLWEPPAISPGMYQDFLTNKDASTLFHKIFTYDPRLMDSNPTKFTRYLAGDSWVRTNSMLSSDTAEGREIADFVLQQAIRGKRDGVSMIFSKKQTAPVCLIVKLSECSTSCTVTGHA
jgi:hypothetical protein